MYTYEHNIQELGISTYTLKENQDPVNFIRDRSIVQQKHAVAKIIAKF